MEAAMEVKEDGPSFPSNYVTIHDLKQRWLQQHQIPKKSNNDSQLNPKPTTIDNSNNSASIPLASNYPNLHHKISPQNPSQSVEETKKHHRSRYQKLPREPEPESEPRQQSRPKHTTNDAAAPAPAQKESRNQKSKHKAKTPPSVPRNKGGGGGVVTGDDAVGSPVKEQHEAGQKTTTEPFTRKNDHDGVAPVKEQLQSGQRSRNQKVFLPKTPPIEAAAATNDDAAVATPVKFQNQSGRLSRNQKVVRPKSPPVAAVKTVTVTNQAGRLSRNQKAVRPKSPHFDAAAAADDGGLVEVEAVKELDVCNVSHTRTGYRRFERGLEQRRGWSRSNRYPKPPYRGNTPQMSQVWVKKGESAPNSKPLVEGQRRQRSQKELVAEISEEIVSMQKFI